MSHRYLPKGASKSRPPSRGRFLDDDDEEEDDIDLGKSEEDDDDEDYTGYQREVEANYRIRNPKRRRMEDFNNNNAAAAAYEFRPRNVNSGRVMQPDWTDHSTQVLLETWGDRFLQLGRSSLRGDDWCEVAERVSETTGLNFGVSDCRSRLNVLKGKYKREREKVKVGSGSKWAYFKKMDVLMTMPPRQQQQCGLACGVDSGEFVFMDPKVYLDHSNAMDEMRDSPGNSESEGEDEEDEVRDEEEEMRDMESYKMLSDSIKRVGEIYEKIENSKRQHMMELEGMRMEFQRDLELQKKEMIERTRAEIARLREDEEDDDDEEDGDCSGDTCSE